MKMQKQQRAVLGKPHHRRAQCPRLSQGRRSAALILLAWAGARYAAQVALRLRLALTKSARVVYRYLFAARPENATLAPLGRMPEVRTWPLSTRRCLRNGISPALRSAPSSRMPCQLFISLRDAQRSFSFPIIIKTFATRLMRGPHSLSLRAPVTSASGS